jgi:hypothetical protein
MSETTNWAGTVSGAGTLTATVEIVRNETRIEGKLRLVDAGVGQLQANLVGEWRKDNTLSARLEAFTGTYVTPVVLPRTGTLEGTFDQEQRVFRGHWSTDVGTAGEFLWSEVSAPPKNVTVSHPAVNLSSRFSRKITVGAKSITSSLVRWHRRHPDWPVLVLGVVLTAAIGIFLLDFMMGLSN